MRRSNVPSLLLTAVLLVAPNALAEGAEATKPSSLSWVELPGAESCGGALAVARLVEERLGRHALVAPSQAGLSLEGRVEHAGVVPYWHAVLVVRDADGVILGSRDIVSEASACDELRESVAIAVALMIDPNATIRPAPPRVSLPVSEPAPPQAASNMSCTAADSNPQASGRWRVEADSGPELAYGFLPSPSLGVAAGITVVSAGFWHARAYAAALSPQTRSVGGGASARLTVAYGGLLLCPATFEDTHRRSLDLCGGAQVGSLGATGGGFSENSGADTAPFVDLVGAVSLVVPIAGPLAVRLGATGGIAAIRNRVAYDDTTGTRQVAYVAPLVNAMADVGVSMRLP
jgi:hypothetical protein